MSDQLQYTEGTWVWAKLMKNIWWPGKIVLKDKVPHTIDKYINDKFNRCGEPFAIVYFEKDYTHEVVYNRAKICLYNSTNKMEYVEKGYASYVKQTRGLITPCRFNFELFVTAVTTIETELGGDMNIFQQFKKKYEVVRPFDYTIYFPSTKSKKKSKNSRKSFTALSSPIVNRGSPSLTATNAIAAKATATKVTNIKATSKKVTAAKSTPTKYTASKMTVTRERGTRESGTLNKSLTITHKDFESELYYCKLKSECTFRAIHYDDFKKHMQIHVNEELYAEAQKRALNNTSSNSCTISTSLILKKRINSKNKIGNQKKIKLNEEITNDWDDDSDKCTKTDDENKAIVAVNEEKNKKTVDKETTTEKFDGGENTKSINVNENIEAINENRILETNYAEKITETVNGDENQKSIELNDITETLLINYEEQIVETINAAKCTETMDVDEITKTVDADEQLKNVQIKQTVNIETVSEEYKLVSSCVKTNTSIVPTQLFDVDDNSSDFINNLNGRSKNNYDEIKCIATVSKKFLEESNSFASISSCSNLSDTDNTDNVNGILQNIKNNIISSGNANLDTNIISNDTNLINAVNPQTDDNILNNLSIVSSEKSKPCITKIDDKDTMHSSLPEVNYFRGLKDLPTPDWAILEKWEELPNNGFNEAVNFTSIDRSRKIPLGEPITLLSAQPLPFEPKTTLGIVEEKCPPGFMRQQIWVPYDQEVKIHSTEELLKLPLIQKIQNLVATGQGQEVRVTINGAKLVTEE